MLNMSKNEISIAGNEGFIEVGKFKLGYCIEGTGIPTIVIGSAIYYPRTFSTALREHMRFIFIDHRGFSPVPEFVDQADYEFDVILEDIEHIRQKLELGRVMVIGHSGNGYMALEYAKKYPQHVSHVVMLGIMPDLSEASNQQAEQYWRDSVSPKRKASLEENLRALHDEKLSSSSSSEYFIKQYIQSAPRIWYDYKFDASPLWQGIEINMEIFTYIWGTVFRDIDITNGLDVFTIPVFLGLGRYDFLAPPCLWNPIRSKFKNLTVRVFEQSGHTPQLEEPDMFDKELLQWLSKSQ